VSILTKSTKIEQALAWKKAIIDSAPEAIEYFLPDIAADIDKSKKIVNLDLMVKGLKNSDVILEAPIKGQSQSKIKAKTVTCLIAQHFGDDEDIGARMYELYLRLRARRHQAQTILVLVIYTDHSENVNSYTETVFDLKITFKFRIFHLINSQIDELKRDTSPFGQLLYAGRMAYDLDNKPNNS
jgi:hypothetical protein